MDISIIGEKSLKIRGKLGSFIVDPESTMPKNTADGILLQNPNADSSGISKVADYRIIVHGSGDYEVGGIKVAAMKRKESLSYRLHADDVEVLLGKSSELSNDEKIDSCDILLLNADVNFDEALVAKIDPKVVILYGTGAKEALKKLGKESLPAVKKYTAAKDKLPEEMETIILG